MRISQSQGQNQAVTVSLPLESVSQAELCSSLALCLSLPLSLSLSLSFSISLSLSLDIRWSAPEHARHEGEGVGGRLEDREAHFGEHISQPRPDSGLGLSHFQYQSI